MRLIYLSILSILALFPIFSLCLTENTSHARKRRQTFHEWVQIQRQTTPFHRPDYPLFPITATTLSPLQWQNWNRQQQSRPMQVVNNNPTPIYLTSPNARVPPPNPYVVYNRPREPQMGYPNVPMRWNYTQGNPLFPSKGYLPNQLQIMPYFNTYVGPEPTKPSPIGLYPEQLRPPPATFNGYNRNRFFYNKYETLSKVPGLAQIWDWNPRKDLENNNRFNRPW